MLEKPFAQRQLCGSVLYGARKVKEPPTGRDRRGAPHKTAKSQALGPL